jgi:hypothetical protein
MPFAKAQKSHYVLGLAQREEDRHHVNGPKMHLYVLKDSDNGGTTGAWLECAADSGVGDNGFPGLVVEKVHDLPIPARPHGVELAYRLSEAGRITGRPSRTLRAMCERGEIGYPRQERRFAQNALDRVRP